jgi:hypothetical protein
MRPRMVAEISVQSLLQRPRSQTQGLPPSCPLHRLEVYIGDGLTA